MAADQPKKLIIINILDVLKKYSDENHRLSQKEISNILKREYNMSADRKAIKRNILNLIDFGYEIEYTETVRVIKNTKTGRTFESTIMSDFYLVREFNDCELKLLIDGLLFAKHIPYNRCKELVSKLENLSSVYFKSRVKQTNTPIADLPQNRQLFYTIDIIDEAISKNKQVSFKLNQYGEDKKLHPIKDACGNDIRYIVNPYQMAAMNGKYYLICNYDKHECIANTRLDKITDIKIVDKKRKPVKNITGFEHGLDLQRYMSEHMYMFSGESVFVIFRAKKCIINDIVDWFGSDIIITNYNDTEIEVRAHVNYEAMRRWGQQYAMYTRVICPQSLVSDIKNDIEKSLNNYER